MWKLRPKRLATVCSVCTSGVSVVCMTSMGAALAAAGASAGASATSILSVHQAMGHSASGSSAFRTLVNFFDQIGLGWLNSIPNAVAQPLLVALLTVSIGSSYLAFRSYRRPHALIATLLSSLILYAGIYIYMSDLLYFLGLGGLLGAGIGGMFLRRTVRNAPVSRTTEELV